MEIVTDKKPITDIPTVNETSGSGNVTEAISPTPSPSDVLTPRLGRPRNGKRSSPDHVQITAYIPRSVHAGVMMRLTADRYQDNKTQDFSDLVGDLLSDWLSKQPEA